MAISLEEIKSPIQKELIHFEEHFKSSMQSDVALLDKITYYIIKSKGKQVRPMFVFLSAKMHGETTEHSYTAASLIELLHTATLVHDDVVDDSYERRGFMSINALWKNKIAVLVGDYLLSQGLLLALNNDQFELLKIMSTAVKSMSEGELLQIEKARKLDIKEDVYFDIITKKTASLIASACSAGAASVTNDKDVVEKMKQLGLTIGICFQIKDDLFDYGDADIGKPLGIDIKEQKMTLPLIHALSKATYWEKSKIINIVKNNNNDPKKVAEVIAFVKNKGGIEYTESAMQNYYEKALRQLSEFPDSVARETMKKLITFTIERKK
jgi:octaprenyl-diphosphate synthase